MNTFRDNDLCGNIALINVLKPFFDIIPIEISALTGYTRSCLLILLFFFFKFPPRLGERGALFLEVLQYQVDAWSGWSKLLFQLPAPKIH